jgi:hypothetical protein
MGVKHANKCLEDTKSLDPNEPVDAGNPWPSRSGKASGILIHITIVVEKVGAMVWEHKERRMRHSVLWYASEDASRTRHSLLSKEVLKSRRRVNDYNITASLFKARVKA